MTDDRFRVHSGRFLRIFSGIIFLADGGPASRSAKDRENRFRRSLVAGAGHQPTIRARRQARDDELDRIKRRLQVLERIATDSSTRLESELDDLRRA